MTDPSDLCTVTPTIFKTCNNDWISEEGTCYEDSCCTSFETATSWYYRLAQLSHVVFSGLGLFIIILYSCKYASKHILPHNVRVLTYIMLFLMFTHSVDMILIHIYHIVQSYRVVTTNPCFLRVKVSFCAPFRYTFSFCTFALASCQYCVYIERLLCAFYDNYIRHRKIILHVLIAKWFILSSSMIMWVYREEDSDSYLLSCLNIPLASMEDLSLITAALFPINMLCFYLSIIMFRHFKKKEKGSRFEIHSHFTAAVDVESSKFLYFVTRTQSFFIVLFPVLSLSMRFFYEDTPRPLHLTFATLSYVFSIYCFTVPLVMINYGRRTTEQRKAKIWSHVRLKSVGKEGADNYFGMMKSQWE